MRIESHLVTVPKLYSILCNRSRLRYNYYQCDNERQMKGYESFIALIIRMDAPFDKQLSETRKDLAIEVTYSESPPNEPR